MVKSKVVCAVLLFLVFVLPIEVAKADGQAFAVLDAETGRLLFGENEHDQLPIASLTKIWTAYVVAEQTKLDEQVVVPQEVTQSEGSSIYLTPGETVTISTLLYGLMLRSGNDAAYTLAEYAGGSQAGFVQLMNEKAAIAGLENTHFENPSGLHHPKHLSSAYDTAQMLRLALQNDEFKKIASSKEYKADITNGGVWENKHKLVRETDYAVAGKTGFTKAARRTLATYFEKDGKKIIVVTLNESNDWNRHEELANFVFDNYEYQTIVEAGTYKVQDRIQVKLKAPVQVLVHKQGEKGIRNVLEIPRKENKEGIARWSVYIDGQRVKTNIVKIDWD